MWLFEKHMCNKIAVVVKGEAANWEATKRWGSLFYWLTGISV